MKAIKLLVTTMFFCNAVMGQNGLSGMDGSLNMNSGNFILLNLKDVKSEGVINPDFYAGVEGSPYLFDSWVNARIMLADGRKFDSVLLKLNLYDNKIHFKDENGHERMIATDVRQVEIRDISSKWNNHVFLSGYGEDKNIFYQAVTDGKKVGLLKKMNVLITEMKVFNGPTQKKFELQERLYVYSAGTLYQEGKNCSVLLSAFGNDSKVSKFISSNDIKCNKEKDMTKLVDYYNSY